MVGALVLVEGLVGVVVEGVVEGAVEGAVVSEVIEAGAKVVVEPVGVAQTAGHPQQRQRHVHVQGFAVHNEGRPINSISFCDQSEQTIYVLR